MTEYEYVPVSRRRDAAPFVSGAEQAFIAQTEWEAITDKVYATEGTARSLLTRRMRSDREYLFRAKAEGNQKRIAFYDKDYAILRRPVAAWQEYEWQRR